MIKMLLVDDERIIRESLIKMIPLSDLEIQLTGVCANAFEALESISDDMPEILLTDVKMPQMDGLALVERSLKMNPQMETVILSGYDEFAYAQKAISLGVREYLLKPCTKQDITDCLTRICKRIRQRKETYLMQMNNRAENVKALADALISLSINDITGRIESGEVRNLIEIYHGESLIREVYTYMVTHYEVSPDRGFAMLREAYLQDDGYITLLASWLTHLQEHPSRRKREFVIKMCRYIQEHFHEESLSLQFLADHVVHMRADYIGREFARDTGQKVSSYLLQVRMEKAKQFLEQCDDEMYVYQVAERVGLGHNPQYFSQLFKRYTGMTPKEYTKKP